MLLLIDNMNCGGCAKSVTKAIQTVDPQATVDIDLATKGVTVCSDADERALVAGLEKGGFRVGVAA